MLDTLARLALAILSDHAVMLMLASIVANLLARPKLASFSHRLAHLRDAAARLHVIGALVALAKAAMGSQHPEVQRLLDMAAKMEAGK